MTANTTKSTRSAVNNFSPLTRFVLWASGGNQAILRRCPTDLPKMTGIGAAVILTSLLAFASGSYALWWVFKSWPVALLVGLLWMTVIFNIDRLMVLSIRKTVPMIKQLAMAAPRAVIAVMIGIVIAYPLELRMFETAIQQHIAIDNKNQLEQMKTDDDARQKLMFDHKSDSARKAQAMAEQNEPRTLTLARQNQLTASANLKAEEAKVRALNHPYITELSHLKALGDTSLTTRRRLTQINGLMAANAARLIPFSLKVKKADELVNSEERAYFERVNRARMETEKVLGELTKRKGADIKATDSLQTAVVAALSLEPDLSVVSRAYGAVKDSNHEIATIGWMLTILFVAIELLPVLMKLLMVAGPYDYHLERHEEIVRMSTLESREKFENQRVSRVEMDASLQKHASDEELTARKAVIAMIRKAQEDLTAEIISLWKKRQIDDIHNNIDRYIVTEERKN